MKALVLQAKDTYPILKETPFDPIDGLSTIEIQAAALNRRDYWITKGLYPNITFPIILGSDGCGTCNGEEVIINPGSNWGNNTRAQSVDYEVLGLPQNGTLAEKVQVDSSRIYPKPTHLDAVEASALPLAGLTAYRALFTKGRLTDGQNVLINGVGGGVATMAFLMALNSGANVFVTSGSESKLKTANDLGAKGGVNYKKKDFDKELNSLSGGFDLIIDSAAGDPFATLVKLCQPGARIVFYGGTLGKINNLNPQLIFWRQISIHGTTMGSDREFEDMLAFVTQHKIVPIIDSVYKFSEVNDAFDRLKNSQQFGKIVLKPE